ncbi:hydroxyacid dehydrogenase [Devosia sp.]|uniref:hydroxyacid dehydrogenase n=1 Tax=Devosia sp. TaxID=1871048 RepID=UPI001AC6ACDE|nr:hydroxyacid dehydrogenase [Devosia sp.]MBN9332034.1 hydroxyacid dehydrogenase [Devosia sp.]
MYEARDRSGRKPILAFAYDPSLTRGIYSDAALARLHSLCDIPDVKPIHGFEDEDNRALLAEVSILATGWGCPRLDSSALRAMPQLSMVAHGAGTVKSFIAPAIYEAGITVTNAVAANAVPVAEFTLASILLANKRVLFLRDLYRQTREALHRHPVMESTLGNYRKTIGIVGASHIGRLVLELLRPFDFSVLLADPYLSPDAARHLGARLVPLEELLAQSHVVSLHAPALASTRHMIDARRLALLRDGATFINTARGSLVDQDALTAELVAGRIDAVIDVTEPEVLPAASPLYDLPNVLLTPHIAGAVGGERERLGDMAVDEIERFVTGQPLRHAIDPALLEKIA